MWLSVSSIIQMTCTTSANKDYYILVQGGLNVTQAKVIYKLTIWRFWETQVFKFLFWILTSIKSSMFCKKLWMQSILSTLLLHKLYFNLTKVHSDQTLTFIRCEIKLWKTKWVATTNWQIAFGKFDTFFMC